ncbi:aminoacyl-histidine dipeptidase [Leptotrichia sp. oral taxon 215]|uniref:aminoacyl-histidine dipeptidase n=1 Tax=Leptotrichia sp. oral taxon 215 TaxID=712359 RepID=UPI0004014557|nr:aminoacyl-histidine dipeptidase [Leptotrichia sp. oral taxon 215]
MSIEKLYPEKVFHYFAEISKIPRASKKEKEISDWLVKFAKERKLKVIQDEHYNVIIKKKATEGYEDFSPLILQGHMDMVWEKNKDTEFDFSTQGIELVIDGDFLKANGTTLGADNGIAIAYALAILDSDDIKHPALEVVITTDEEDGMSGVANLDFDEFDGKTLINLDTEEYGEVYVSSAGGTRTETKFIFETKKIGNGCTPVSIEVKGLSGGHSGAEIHKNLGNSIKILSEVLYHLSKRYEMSLIHIDGGGKVNAIPREAVAEIAVKLDGDSIDEFKKLAELAFENILKDFKVSDKSPILAIEKIEEKNLGISLGDTLNIINFLHEVPNGVLEMSKHIEGLVETSINIGFISTEIVDGNVKIRIKSLARSMANDPLNKLVEEITDLTRKHDANIKIAASNPSWEYKEDSKIRELIAKSFKEITGNEPVIKAIHAGLECGVFTQNIKGADVVSIGPNIYGAHTPEERMDIKSVGETWEWLLKILENYNIKED